MVIVRPRRRALPSLHEHQALNDFFAGLLVAAER
jgi:hypothetical protein